MMKSYEFFYVTEQKEKKVTYIEDLMSAQLPNYFYQGLFKIQ